MIEKIIQQAVTNDLADLAEIFTKRGGVVRTQVKKDPQNGTLLFPVEVVTDAGECEPGNYRDFMPNSAENGILYFELLNTTKPVEQPKGVFYESADLRLVAWFNKLRISPSDSLLLAANVVKAFQPKQPNISTYLKNIFLTFDGIEEKSVNVFSRYNYDEGRTQFLMHPYDFFSIRYRASWSFIPSCAGTIEAVENACS